VKEGWVTKPLGELCRIEIGGTPPRSNSKFWDEKKATDNVWVSIADMPKTLHAKISTSAEHLSNEGAKRVKLVKAGTLLVSFKLTLGRLAYADIDLRTNEAIAALTLIDGSSLSQEYLYWYLTFFDWQKAAEGEDKIKGKTLNKAKLAVLPIFVPPLPEQQRIVAILDEVFAGLATATANAEKNLKNARELFDSHLNSIFTNRTEGWVDKSLREVSTEFGRGKSKHRPRNDPGLYDGKYPFIQTGDIRNADHVIVDYSQSYNEKGLAQSKLWPKGTICITIAANIAETGILGFDACFPDSVIGMVVDPIQTNNKFVEYLLRFFKAVLQAQGKGSAQDNINLATFENRKFPFPPVNVQNQLVERLDAAATQTRRLEACYEAGLQFISELKQSVLHRAFSGELTSPPSQAVKEAAE